MENILKQLTPYIAEHLEQVFTENSEYQRAVKTENDQLQLLSNKLQQEQTELFEHYFTANCETAAIREFLSYQQGMKDMFTFLRYLSK